jgi:hypothetical protein
MKKMRTAIAIAALFAFAALTPLAAADKVVPPGNSAATQYTETFPTSGGEADVNKEIDASNLKPSKVLGKNKTKDLESQGADGKAVAEIAAVTAPNPVATEDESTPAPSGEQPKGGKKKDGSNPAGGSAGNSGGSGGTPTNKPPTGGGGETAALRSVTVSEPSGSSGLGEVLGQATGSSSGQLGLLLPLLILGTVIWAMNYAWRQRQTAA